MKIAIFHPQLKTYGGGELIGLIIACHLSKKHQVDVFSPYPSSKEDISSFFGLKMDKVNFKKLGPLSDFALKVKALKPYRTTVFASEMLSVKGYDLIFDTGANGIFWKSPSARTACYINFMKFPRLKKGWKSFLNFLLVSPEKGYRYDLIISNSSFTRKAVHDYSGGKDSIVIFPPVKTARIKSSANKKRMIVSVGRFSPEKKHEVMIHAFRDFCRKEKGWQLHLIGQFRPGAGYSQDYYDRLKEEAKGLPVIFHENMPHEAVMRFLSYCSIYWHARGYGETDPEEMENFGMSTVEAMAAGCVPVVINMGAQPEIVDHRKCGFCWEEPEQLVSYTLEIIRMPKLAAKLRTAAIRKSKSFSEERFCREIDAALEKIFS